MSGLALSPSFTPQLKLSMQHQIARMAEFANVLELSQDELASKVELEAENNPVLEMEKEFLTEPKYDWDRNVYQPRNPDLESFQEYRVNSISRHESLHTFLRNQLLSLDLGADTQGIGETIIANIGDNGYLSSSCEEIALELSVSAPAVEEALTLIQHLDPAGVGARNVKECLCIQINRHGFGNSDVLTTLVKKHSESLALGRLEHIAESMRVSVSDVKMMQHELSKMNRGYGEDFASYTVSDAIYAVPDVVVETAKDGEFIVHLAEDVQQGFHLRPKDRMPKSLFPDDENWVKSFKNDRQAAKQLMDVIELRRQTILGVASAIVEKQPEFILKGQQALKPMKLEDVAALLGVHYSTVSRATNGKYIETPRGLFEMRSLFVSGLPTDSGEELSVHEIEERIRTLVDTENRARPLSDEKLKVMLRDQGIAIARRTVTKSRERIGVPKSRKRRELALDGNAA